MTRRSRITITPYIIDADGTRFYRENPNTRVVRRLLIAGAMPFLIMLMIAAAVGTYRGVTMHTHTTKVDSTVKDFNEGFADSKQDDCEQGFAPACEWIATTKR
jgi:hypothetical protein